MLPSSPIDDTQTSIGFRQQKKKTKVWGGPRLLPAKRPLGPSWKGLVGELRHCRVWVWGGFLDSATWGDFVIMKKKLRRAVKCFMF